MSEYNGEERRKSDTVLIDIAILKEARKITDSTLIEIKESLHDVKESIYTGNKDLLEEFKKNSYLADKRFLRLELWRSYLTGAYVVTTAIGAAIMGWLKSHNGK